MLNNKRRKGGGAAEDNPPRTSLSGVSFLSQILQPQNELHILSERRWSQPHFCPGIHAIKIIGPDECVWRMWSIHAMEYYLTLRKKEILTHATT